MATPPQDPHSRTSDPRPEVPAESHPPNVLFIYEGDRRRVRRAAASMAACTRSLGAEPTLMPVAVATRADVERADSVIVGCRARTRYPFGGEPVRDMCHWIEDLPPLEGKPAGVFCTYGFFPRTFADTVTRVSETLDMLSRRLTAKGARVVADHAFDRASSGDLQTEFVANVLERTAA
jgi:hypothetical protein